MARNVIDKIKDRTISASDKAISYVSDRIKVETDAAIRKAEDRINKIETKIINNLIGLSLMGASIIFLAISGFYFMREFLLLSNTVSFLIIGLILLTIGIIIKKWR